MKMKSSNKNYTVAQSHKEMAKVAQQILDGKIAITDAARELTALRFPSRAEKDKDILVFVGIDSETHEFPVGKVRKFWNSEILKAKDEELKKYEERVKDRAFVACKNIIAKYGDS
jgi:hypothetical protein